MNMEKKHFTMQEDTIILEHVKKYGECKWLLCANMLPGRNESTVRERYKNYLSPNVSKSQWTPQEDSILLYYSKIFPNKWSYIVKFLPGRTDKMCRNRYSSIRKSPPHLKFIEQKPRLEEMDFSIFNDFVCPIDALESV